MSGFQAERQPGVVDQQVHFGEIGGQGGDSSVHCCFVAHVKHDGVNRNGCGQFGAQGFQAVLAATANDQMPAMGSEQAGASGAETGRSAGDKGNLGHRGFSLDKEKEERRRKNYEASRNQNGDRSGPQSPIPNP